MSRIIGDIYKTPSVGVGLRAPHYQQILNGKPTVTFFEAISENYMGLENSWGGNSFQVLEQIRKDYPVVLHGVSLSIGSADAVDRNYLQRLKELISKIQPAWVSDHFCWTGVDGENTHDLLPLPYTQEVISHLVQKIHQVQEFLGTEIVLENVSSYLSFKDSEMPEWEFITEVVKRSGCKVLLDLNNIFVSSVNHQFNPAEYLEGVPVECIKQFHLAGHLDLQDHLVDTHDQPVSEPVWALYSEAVRRFGPVPTLVEWDSNIPKFEVLQAEVDRACMIQEIIFERTYCVARPLSLNYHETRGRSQSSEVKRNPKVAQIFDH